MELVKGIERNSIADIDLGCRISTYSLILGLVQPANLPDNNEDGIYLWKTR